jgi:hypothetical protein
MTAWNGELTEDDVARVLAANSGVHDHLAGLAVPARWADVLEQAERGGDPSARWHAHKLATIQDSVVGFKTGNGQSDEVGRRFVDPIVAATLARPLPPVEFQEAVSNCSTILPVAGDEAWQAYAAEVRHVMDAAESSPEEAARLLSIGAANLQAQDADAPEFINAVTAHGASEREAEWLLVAAAARSQGWDPTKLQGQAFLRRFNTAGIAAPGTTVEASGAETTAAARGAAAPRSRGTTHPSIGN